MRHWQALILLCALVVGGEANADKKKARELYKRGMAEYTLEHWEPAIAQFEEGFRESPEPAFLFNIGQAHRQAGHHVDAIRFFHKYLDFAPDAKDREEVERNITDEEQKLAEEQAALAAAAAAQAAAPRPLEPALAPVPAAPLLLAPPPPPPARVKKRWPLFVGLGIGAAVVVGGVVGLAVALTTPNDAAIPPTSAGNINARFQ